jgi:hypothetical protein
VRYRHSIVDGPESELVEPKKMYVSGLSLSMVVRVYQMSRGIYRDAKVSSKRWCEAVASRVATAGGGWVGSGSLSELSFIKILESEI